MNSGTSKEQMSQGFRDEPIDVWTSPAMMRGLVEMCLLSGFACKSVESLSIFEPTTLPEVKWPAW